ncbi:MAG: hypothetical protein QM804_01120 [Propionicimonas sp.]
MDSAQPWIKVMQIMDRATRVDRDVPTFMRVVAAARLRARPDGNAYFHRGELAKLVAWVDPSTGETGPVVKDVQRSINKCVGKGYFLAGSDTLEIRLNTEVHKRGRDFQGRSKLNPGDVDRYLDSILERN